MRILLVSEGTPRLRHFETVLLLLAQRGHTITVAVEPDKAAKGLRGELADEERISLVTWSEGRPEQQRRAILLLRLVRDYLRYLEPPLDAAFVNRARSLELLSAELRDAGARLEAPLADPPVALDAAGARFCSELLARVEETLPADPAVQELVAGLGPDVVLVTPLITHGSPQIEIVKAARALGVPSGLLVFSWDNLSNKGLIRVAPDRVFVWNDVQRLEAVELQGVPPEAVVVTGASRFDPFFAMRPSMTREELCAAYGLDPARPILLYLGSSDVVCPDERPVVDCWLAAVRSSPDPRLAGANVIVRPHPRRRAHWRDWQGRGGRGVATSDRPLPQADQSLYDELFHSVAAVGLNTSAQLEAAILGRPVYTFAAGERAPGQAGSLHFYYLLRGHGGVVEHSGTLAEHVGQLARAVAGEYDAAAIRAFAESFVRPHGLDVPATPILADAILELSRSARPGPARSPGRR